MLDYEKVKDFYTEKLLNDRKGRGRLESAAFHTVEFAYFQGIRDSGAVAEKLDKAIALLEMRGPGYANVLAIVNDVRAQIGLK